MNKSTALFRRSAPRRAESPGTNTLRSDAPSQAAGGERRLLSALAAAGGFGTVDPIDSDYVIARTSRLGVSLGSGRFPAPVAAALVREDLAVWKKRPGAAPVLVATEAGLACLRRAAAGPAEAFREQHGAVETVAVATPSGRARLRVNLEESPLEWLRRRRGRDGEQLIDEAAHQAGERLRRDITLAGLLPGVTASWNPVRADGAQRGPAEATDRMVAARQRLRLACEAVGPDFSDLLIDLCGFLKGLETIERDRGWPPRSGKVVVRLALARLAAHYGLANAATGAAGSRIRAWQEGG